MIGAAQEDARIDSKRSRVLEYAEHPKTVKGRGVCLGKKDAVQTNEGH